MEKEKKGLTILSIVFFVLGVYFLQWLATFLIDYANTFYNELFFFPVMSLKVKFILLCVLFLGLVVVVGITMTVTNKRIDHYWPSFLEIFAGLYLAVRSGIILDCIIIDLDDDMSLIYYIYNIGFELLALLGGLTLIVFGGMRFRKHPIRIKEGIRYSVIVIYVFVIIGTITLMLIPLFYYEGVIEDYWLALLFSFGASVLVIAGILLRIVILLKNMKPSNKTSGYSVTTV